jgi:glycosyltransferase involved in cell wall biosynthesis
MVYYYNASDVALLTSFDEGSPNVIKEAMACNCPIVSTNVGDVQEVIGNTEGCFVCNADAGEIANKVEIILKNRNRTNGRDHIQHLRSEKVASRIKDIYLSVISKKNTK